MRSIDLERAGPYESTVRVAIKASTADKIAIAVTIASCCERMLTQQCREFEEVGIVHREVYPEVPPKVECSLTDYGNTLSPITEVMCEWGKKHMKRIKARKK